MTSLTVGWIAGILLLALGIAVGFVGRPYYDQWRNTKPAPGPTPPPPPPSDPLRRIGFGPFPMPGEQQRMADMRARTEATVQRIDQARPRPPQQPAQVARTPARPATVPPLRKPVQPVRGKHRPETVPTQAMPVVKPTKEVS